MDNLAAELARHEFSPHLSTSAPLAGDALTKLRAGPSISNPLVPSMVTPARRIIGTVGFIVGVRPDARFAFCVLARHVNETTLTDYAWHEILRLGHYY